MLQYGEGFQLSTDQSTRPKRWSDTDSALVRQSLDEYVTRAAARVGRSRFAVQCRIMQELGVSQKEIDRIVKSRKRRGPLATLVAKVWEFTNHQVVGGVLLTLVLLLAATLYGVLTHS